MGTLSSYPVSTDPTNARVAGVDSNNDVVLFTFETITALVTSALNDEVATRESQVQTLTDALAQKANTSALASYLTISAASSTYATQSALTSGLSGKANSSELSNYVLTTALTSTLTNYLTTSAAASTYATQSALTSGLSGKANSADLANYVTSSTAAATYLTQSNAASTYQTISGMSSYATTSALTSGLSAKVNTTAIGAANGIAPLGADSKISATYLPSYVDDVVEYNGIGNRPATGETGKIYVDTSLTTNNTFRWGGSAYALIASSPGTTDSLTEGTNNLYFTPGRAQNALASTLSSYLTTSAAASTYQTQSGMSAYLTTSAASTTYQTQAGMSSYLTSSTAASTYLTQSNAASTYLSQSSAASTYATQSALTSGLSGKANTSHTHAISDVTNLQTSLDGKQASLGFTPVRQGGGTGQLTNTVYIGWSSGSRLKATVDSTDLGNIVFDSQLSSYATQSYVTSQGYITSAALSGYATQSYVTSQGYATQSYVNSQGFITSAALSGYATQSYVTSQGYITSAALSGYATESYVTSRGYATTSYVDGKVAAGLSYIAQTSGNTVNLAAGVVTVDINNTGGRSVTLNFPTPSDGVITGYVVASADISGISNNGNGASFNGSTPNTTLVNDNKIHLWFAQGNTWYLLQ